MIQNTRIINTAGGGTYPSVAVFEQYFCDRVLVQMIIFGPYPDDVFETFKSSERRRININKIVIGTKMLV